ncbi:MAG: hypothetical protein ABJA02_10635 [Acidobacteriota bacterium]
MADLEPMPDEPVLNEIRFQTEDIAFASEDLVTCTGCKRQNPPNRLNCLYCGNSLPVHADRIDLIKPVLRPIEPWEVGFSVIARTDIARLPVNLTVVERVTGLGPEKLKAVVSAGQPMPLAMFGSRHEAEVMAAALEKLGVPTVVISDGLLSPVQPPVRLRAITINDESLTFADFNSGNLIDVPRAELVLIVQGIISESRTDQLEKKRRGKESKVLDEVETENDQAVVDIYLRTDAVGFRVMLAGFDFACLGDDKSYIAAENIRRLVTVLHELVPEAKVASDYRKLRVALEPVWPIDTRKDSLGLQRSGFGRVEFGNRISSSNFRQLNRFSRLQWHLL